jgi:23S rRNA pseudouridine1911/1915/1917 synthase
VRFRGRPNESSTRSAGWGGSEPRLVGSAVALGGIDMTDRLEEMIPSALGGDRVDRVVALLGDLSRATVKRLVDAGAVTLDGVVVQAASRRVVEGELLGVILPDEVDPRPAADGSIELVVRFEDEHVVVIDKPAGLVVHPGAGNDDGTLVNALVHHYPEVTDVGEIHRPGIVHRLDRGTSGLLVIARSAAAHVELVRQLAAHEPERVYTALVWGHLESDSGTIDAPIGRSPRQPIRMAVSEQGRHAVTHYCVDARYTTPRDTSLLTCRLETGRTHQIRVHLRAIGHPVVGDRDYDGGRPGLDPGRPFLHAGELRFVHPITGAQVVVVSPLPDDLVACLNECG